MVVRMPMDMDYLSANMHGRRSRLAEAERLDALCRIRTIPELVRAVAPDAESDTAVALQRRLVQDVLKELEWLVRLTPTAHSLFDWMRTRFQVENLKVLARGFAAGARFETLAPHLLPLPKDLAVDAPALAAADSIEAFASLVRSTPLWRGIQAIFEVYHNYPRSFFIEAALDRSYFIELLVRLDGISESDRADGEAVIRQEVDTFHMMLVTRGKFHYGLKPEQLMPFHVAGTVINRRRLRAMLSAPDLGSAAARAVGAAIDAMPLEMKGPGGAESAADLEALAWNRFLRLANRAFRWNHTGVGAVVGYLAVRRVELANLIILSEGIRAGLAPEAIRRRLIPRTDLETARV